MSLKGKERVVDAADHEEEEDLDDLDDVIHKFDTDTAASKSKPIPAQQQQQAKKEDDEADDPDVPELDHAFLAELTKNMEALFSSLPDQATAPTTSGSGISSDEFDAPAQEDMKRFLEEMLRTNAADSEGAVGEQEIQAAMNEVDQRLKMVMQSQQQAQSIGQQQSTQAKGKGKSSSATAGEGVGEKSFQEKIRKAHDKMRESDQNARAKMDAASPSAAAADPLAALLSNLENGLSDDPNLQEALDAMMAQLMSKDLLYEPIKDLNEKYPEYLKANSATLNKPDLERYKKQYSVIQKIAAKFESENYSDDDPEQGAELVELMQEMQACGAPPKELMGDIPGVEMGADGMPNLPNIPGMPGGDCPQS